MRHEPCALTLDDDRASRPSGAPRRSRPGRRSDEQRDRACRSHCERSVDGASARRCRGVRSCRARFSNGGSSGRDNHQMRRWRPDRAGASDRGRSRTGTSDFERRANGAELPVPSQRRRVVDRFSGRGRARRKGAYHLHTQNNAWLAVSREVRCPSRGRRQPSLWPR